MLQRRIYAMTEQTSMVWVCGIDVGGEESNRDTYMKELSRNMNVS
jgi:hypothetical protein